MFKKTLVFALMGYFCANGFAMADIAEKSSKVSFGEKLKSGETVQVDLLFPYYQNRSAESIASEIALNGFDGILLLVLNEKAIPDDFIQQCHKWGLGVIAQFHAMGFYTPIEVFPENWKDWQIEYTFPGVMENYQGRLSAIHPEYRQWFKKRAVHAIQKYGFDGFGFVEMFYSVYAVPDQQPVFFGDVSETFQKAFIRDTGNKFFPNFTDPCDRYYFKKQPKVYKDLIDYRVKVLVDFADEVINGQGGIRKECPGTVVATWTTGLGTKDGYEHMRISDGQDPAILAKAVKPDIHFVQTNSPDWFRADLPPDYAKTLYGDFFKRIKKANPNVNCGFQADIGSRRVMRKSPQWYKMFVEESRKAGVDVTTYYEFHLRQDIYNTIPQAKLLRVTGRSAKVYFNKYIDPASVKVCVGKSMTDDLGGSYKIVEAESDGNILKILADKPMPSGRIFALPLGGISDYPKVRLPLTVMHDWVDGEELKRRKESPEHLIYGHKNSIPEEEFIFLKS